MNDKKLLEKITVLEKQNETLKTSLEFIHKKYPFLWENISILEKQKRVESKNVETEIETEAIETEKEILVELENKISAKRKELKMLSSNELECTRKVNEVLEARIKRANKALLKSIKLGFKTDYKF
ncbi:MAG: hypothetical protein ACRC1D_00615 [Culicoidibacterales bacterium]